MLISCKLCMRDVLLSGCALLRWECNAVCRGRTLGVPPLLHKLGIPTVKQAQPADENTAQAKLPPPSSAVSVVSMYTSTFGERNPSALLHKEHSNGKNAPKLQLPADDGRRAEPATLLVTFVV